MQLTRLTPLTSLRILHDIPLSSDYQDTLSFGSVSEQSGYFAGQTRYKIDEMSPIHRENTIRVPYGYDALINCNYVMWQNANFSNKWFYAFITGMEWLNINMTLLTVEIDVLQTWYFDYQLKQCWIDRMHVLNDAIGSNLINEGLELGQYVVNETRRNILWEDVEVDEDGNFSNWYIVSASSAGEEGNYAPGQVMNNMYTGLHLHTFISLQQANEYIQSLNTTGKTDAIVTLYMCPTIFFTDGGLPKTKPVSAQTLIDKEESSVNGYVPRNNKLYTYPYSFINVSNLQGNSAQYRYEFFDGTYANFRVSGSGLPDSEMVCVPYLYKGMQYNYDEMLTLNNLPTCSFTTDYYKAWLAQNKSAQSTQLLGTALSIGGSLIGTALTGGLGAPALIGATTQGVNTVNSLMAQKEQAKVTPPQMKGNQSGSTMFGLGQFDFVFQKMSITREFAKRIDDYFTMYGYAIHDFGTPAITGRKNWNYVKTVGCDVIGSFLSEDIAKINSIFDSGIRFWHTKDIGNYSLPNGIV